MASRQRPTLEKPCGFLNKITETSVDRPQRGYEALQLIRVIIEACIRDKRRFRKNAPISEKELLKARVREEDFYAQVQRLIAPVKNHDVRTSFIEGLHEALLAFSDDQILKFQPGRIVYYLDRSKTLDFNHLETYYFYTEFEDVKSRVLQRFHNREYVSVEIGESPIIQLTEVSLRHLKEA